MCCSIVSGAVWSLGQYGVWCSIESGAVLCMVEFGDIGSRYYCLCAGDSSTQGLAYSMPYTVSTHCTLHTAHCTQHTAHCTLNIAHCPLNTAQCTLAHSTRHTAHCTQYTVHCTPHIFNTECVGCHKQLIDPHNPIPLTQ